jgi:predicted PurR-regulated permease PerM
VLGVGVWLVFIFIGSMFMLADPEESLLRPAIRLVSPAYRSRVSAMMDDLALRLRRWVLATLVDMLIVFTASMIGYAVIGLQFALPLALLAGVAEIVPTVGPACACVIAMLFAATVSAKAALGVLLVYLIIQSIEAYLILPMIMKGAVNIHPAVTLFSVVLWGKLFGVPGLMLAIPINLTIAAAVEYLYVRPRDGQASSLK